MRCNSCQSHELFPSHSHPSLVRLALLVLLLHKFRCHNCLKSQINLLPFYWLKLLREILRANI
jgi:hypothetical protein